VVVKQKLVITKSVIMYCKSGITQRELHCNQVASDYNVAPEVLQVEKNRVGYTVCSRQYVTLVDMIGQPAFQASNYTSQAVALIDKLHNVCGMYHGDIHTGNFVVDLHHNKLYLVDFGKSWFINELNHSLIVDITWYIPQFNNSNSATVPHLLAFEVDQVRSLFERL